MEIILPDKIFGIDSVLIKLLIQPIVLIIFLIMLFDLAVFPKISETSSIKGEISKVNANKDKIVEKIKYVNSVPMDELKKNETLLSGSMLYEKDSYYMVGVIRKIADKYSYVVQGFSLSPGKLTKDDTTVKEVSGNKRVPISLSMLGPKAQYLEFLKGLERSMPLLSIEKMEMRARGDVVEMDLEISAYYINEETKPEVKNLSLADLQLDKNEAEMIKLLSSYANNREILSGEQQRVATRSGVIYGRTSPFTP